MGEWTAEKGKIERVGLSNFEGFGRGVFEKKGKKFESVRKKHLPRGKQRKSELVHV